MMCNTVVLYPDSARRAGKGEGYEGVSRVIEQRVGTGARALNQRGSGGVVGAAVVAQVLQGVCNARKYEVGKQRDQILCLFLHLLSLVLLPG